MTKITQIFKDSFKKIKNSITHSSKDEKTRNGHYSEQTTTQEVSSQTRESILETTRQINSTLSSSQRAKDNSKKLQNTSNKPKLTSNTKKKITSPKKSIHATKKSEKSNSKSKNSKTSNSKTSKKLTKKVSYPSGKIVNSQVLNEVERGYLELAGFKNYKDAFIGLETSKKRSQVAKQVATQTNTLSSILKKLELLQVKGVGEDVAFVLSQVGVNSLKKLETIDAEKVYKKINSYTKKHEGVDVKISSKQLEQFSKDVKIVYSAF